jgi:oligopeptide transport system permease protein
MEADMLDNTPSKDKWALVPKSMKTGEKIYSVPSTYFHDVRRRLFTNKLAVISLVVIVLLLLIAVFGPMVSRHEYDAQNLSFVNIPPLMKTNELNGRWFYITTSYSLVEISDEGQLLRAFRVSGEDFGKKLYFYNDPDLTVDFGHVPPVLVGAEDTRLIRNSDYLLGTDMMGRDILVRVLYGARISLMVAFIAAIVNFFIGVLYGGISGYLGGNVDNIMMRIVDVIGTIPLTLYVILIMVTLGSTGFVSIVIALGSVYWVGMARIVRSQVLSLKEQEFVYAAITIGTPPFKILTKHLIPNSMGSIIVTVTMLIPSAIFTESFLSFIGLGVSSPMASWGTLCSDALEGLRISPYQLIFPAAAICLTMFCFNFLGDGMRSALDPKSSKT